MSLNAQQLKRGILGFGVGAILATVAANPARGIQLADGTIYFAVPPRLVEATTTFKETYSWNAIYYFTLSVPADAGEGLERVTIAQGEGAERIRYDLEATRAFGGTRDDLGQEFRLRSATEDREARSISVVFDEPVEPGKMVTIALRPYQNPRYEGVYLFGVTAFPKGEKAFGQFLGFGRFHFYSSVDARFW